MDVKLKEIGNSRLALEVGRLIHTIQEFREATMVLEDGQKG